MIVLSFLHIKLFFIMILAWSNNYHHGNWWNINIYSISVDQRQIIEKEKFLLIKLINAKFYSCCFIFFCAFMIKLFTFVNLTFCFCVFWDQLDINDEENFRTKGIRYTQYLIKRARAHACFFSIKLRRGVNVIWTNELMHITMKLVSNPYPS